MTHDPDELLIVTTESGRTFPIPRALDAGQMRKLEQLRRDKAQVRVGTMATFDLRGYELLENRHLWHRTVMRLVSAINTGGLPFAYWSSKVDRLADFLALEGYDVDEF